MKGDCGVCNQHLAGKLINESNLPKTSSNTPPYALSVWNFSPVFPLFTFLSLAVGWYAQSDWPAADGQAPGRVALSPFLPVRVIEGPRRSVLQTCSPHFRPGQETFLFFQKELSPVGLALGRADRQRQTKRGTRREWHRSTGVTTQPKTGSGTHWGLGGGHFALYLSHYSSPYWLNWWVLTVRDRNIRIGLPQRLWLRPLS